MEKLNSNPHRMKKVLIFLVIAFLFFGILLIAAQTPEPGTTNPTGNTAGGANAGTGTQEKITAGENEVKKVGDKVGELKPDAVTIKGGTLTPGAENSKFNFETKDSELISSGNKINNVESQTSETKAEVKLNKKGGIDEADIKAGKDGTNIQAGGKKSNLEFNAPEGSRVLKNKDNNIFQVELKEGSQIKQEPVKKQKKEGESEEEDKTVQYNSRTRFTKLPDDVAKSLGFKSMEFKGILSHNGDNWFVGKNHETTFKIDGKESLLMKNIYGQVKNVNENLNVYFKQGKYEGNYVHFGKGLEIGSSNNLDGNAVQFLKGNPYLNIGDNGHFAVQSLANSKIIAENGKVSVRGGTIVDQDYTSYLLSEKKSQLLFKEGTGIKGFSGNDIKDKATAPLEFLPFKSDGTPISPHSQKILFDNNKGVKFLEMNQNELDVGRVMINQPVPPSVVPVIPPKPTVIPESGIQAPPDYTKYMGSETVAQTKNFYVRSSSGNAKMYAAALEYSRYKNAMEWTGKVMSNWWKPAVIDIHVGSNLGTGGATSFVFDRGEVHSWRMTIQGTREGLLDAAIPHEVQHMVAASQFRVAIPRWIDEGMATNTEPISEQNKHEQMLGQFRREGRIFNFDSIAQLKNYPRDMMPLYAEGWSTTKYLINLGGGGVEGKRKLFEAVNYANKNGWEKSLRDYYGFKNYGDFQSKWLSTSVDKIIAVFAKIIRISE